MNVLPVQSRADLDAFIEFPYELYSSMSPAVPWVPPLRESVRNLLSEHKNPFFQIAKAKHFLAYHDHRVVGRLTAILDSRLRDASGKPIGSFGFFESVNDRDVACELFSSAELFLRDQGAKIVRGPFHPSPNHECGLLVSHFSDAPYVGMPYTPSYYLDLVSAAGYRTAKDLLTHHLFDHIPFPAKLLRHSQRIRQTEEIQFREANLHDFDREIQLILEIYNDAWEDLWGFLPWAPGEFEFIAKDLKMIIDPRIVLFASVRGEPAGFGIAVEDFNQVLRHIPSGRLFPTGLLKILWALKGPRRHQWMTRGRIMALGIKKRFQPLGLGALFYEELRTRMMGIGLRSAEAGWILEENHLMNRSMKLMGAVPGKRYRIVEKIIDPLSV